ncbi:MAG: hypothetical protein RL272_1309 [Candidatus Parcubacteria bacterium]|jgi:murein DD-endopeptidase MepM/ murein hydrolase activator NlpD
MRPHHRILKRARALSAAIAICTALCAAPFAAAAQTASVADDVQGQIKDISDDVAKKRVRLQELNLKADKYRSVIQQKAAESADIEDQIALIENRTAKTQLDIDIADDEIRRLELEMTVLDGKISDQEKRMTQERALLGVLARKLYRAQYRRSVFDILLTKRTLSEFFDALRQISELQGGVRKTLDGVQLLRTQLAADRKQREDKKLSIDDERRHLEVAKRELDDQRSLKEAILIETKSSELEYRYLLAELKSEQNDADSEISYLEKTLRQKLDLADRLKGQDAVLSWPLVPARGISTQFHDPEYPFRYVFEHPGIDIRADQGTPVRAAAAGVVAHARDAGMGYSYVMLIHNNDISTVYGHLSKIVAKEDQFVERGEIVGYSGGMPGTPGAGRLTTGPHLHFESRLRGIPIDPLQFLVSVQ